MRLRPARKSIDRLAEWIEKRFMIRPFLDWLQSNVNLALPTTHLRRWKSRIFWIGYPFYYLGGIIVVCAITLAITGSLLSVYYVPSAVGGPGEPTPAYESLRYIMTKVPFGYILRGVHHWAANLMIAAVALHMVRVFFTSGYVRPRELNWILGIGLFGLTLLFGFSGYVLPWDQLSYWAGTVGLEITKSIPFVGEMLASIGFGGSLSAETVSKMYGFHVALLPMAGASLVLIHLIIIWIQGMAEPH